MNVRKGLISKELHEECRVLWRTQADAEKPLGALKIRSMLQAQKAVAHLRCTREAGEEEEYCGRQRRWEFLRKTDSMSSIRRKRGRLQGRGRQRRGMGAQGSPSKAAADQ